MEADTLEIGSVGVLGCGLMGSGIAEVCARSGFRTVVRELEQELLDRGLSAIELSLTRACDRGKLTAEQVEGARDRLSGTIEMRDLADCDLVIEAITERRDLKIETYRLLDAVCKPETIFASNTSSLSITELAVATDRPDRFVGLHFFNPVPVMQLVEVVHTLVSDERVVEQARRFAEALGKRAVMTKDRTGFIVNRLLIPYLMEAVRALEEGLASIEDIDAAMRLGCGYRMGPLTLLDFVGLDTTYYIANIFYDEFREARYAPPPLLKRMVLAGQLGRKSGRGFYDYTESKPGEST